MNPAGVGWTCVNFLFVLLVSPSLITSATDNHSKILYIIYLIPFVISFADVSFVLPNSPAVIIF